MTRSNRGRRPSTRVGFASIEALETRSLLSASPTSALSHSILPSAIHRVHQEVAPHPAKGSAHAVKTVHSQGTALTMVAHPNLVVLPVAPTSGFSPLASGPPPSALTPAEIRDIYGINQITNLGQGQTIAIVDAYDDPNIAANADVFDKQFPTTVGGSTSYYTAYGSSLTWLTKAYSGGSKPAGNTGWGQEISLDVEWAHAVAPLAKILLVEAASASFGDLLTGDDYAATHGANVISNSWGGGEFSGENGYDSHFTAAGKTFVFSAGDSGNQSYPALSPSVVSVGGTSLYHTNTYAWSGESGWSHGGGGASSYEATPSYQSGLGYATRANPDVAYNADPYTGFAVYDTYGANRNNPAWNTFGGTSAGAPQWSALIALADQGRAAIAKGSLTGPTQTLPALYALTTGTGSTSGEALYDVTTGSNSVASAKPGYDLVTGKGTPRWASVVYNNLVAAP